MVSRDGLQGQSQAYGSLGNTCSLSEGQPWEPVRAQTGGAGPEACLEQPRPGLVPGGDEGYWRGTSDDASFPGSKASADFEGTLTQQTLT